MMKKYALSFLLIFLLFKGLAQDLAPSSMKNMLVGNWGRYRIDLNDGSLLTDESLNSKTISMFIFKKGGVGIMMQGKNANQLTYTLQDSILTINQVYDYKIEKLTPYELVFTRNVEDRPNNQKLRYQYISTQENAGQYFYRQFIKPFIVVKANGDTAYRFNEHIFPVFKIKAGGYLYELTDFNEVYEQSYNFIEEKFSFPKKQKGDFNVFFVIDEKGMLKNVAIKSSSDSNYNNALLQAVYATRQLWKAAQYQERNVEVQFNYVFKYEDTEEEDNFDYMSYQNILDKAERFYQKKEYVKAIKLYTKCILMKDDYLEPIYKRADSYFAVKSIKNACLDWSYLAKKGQKKAENLFLEHCMK
jgi:hypothetical protein